MDLIDRQAAIKAICEDSTWLEGQGCTDISMAERKQRDADILSDLPSAQPEHRFDEWCTECKEYDHDRHCCPRFNAVIRRTIEELEADRKNGVWIEENTRPWSGQFYCSVCHRTAYDPQQTRAKGWVKRCRYAFCPNCGADMRGEDNG